MDPVVTLESGRVRGVADAGVTRFIGVPYAAPPVGARRFRPPERVQRWDGIREATSAGPSAPQALRPFPFLDVAPLIGSGWRRGDDFLTLNVWTPDPAARGLPVMVFVHGGAWVVGSKDASVHDGSAFARAGIVCVAINYRLGIEGFLPIPGAPTNLGLRDMLHALAWVQANVERFGGDPGNVTAFGESAGSMSLAPLVTSPSARGLFRRVILQSGHASMVRHPDVANRLVHQLAGLLGVAPDIQGFASIGIEQGLKAIEAISPPGTAVDLRDGEGRDAAFGLTRFLPVYGDDVLPKHPIRALEEGAGATVDVLVGTNREEMNLYFVPTGVKAALTEPQALAGLALADPAAAAIYSAYAATRPGGSAGEVFTDAAHDLAFRLPARQFARAHRGSTHLYEFGWRSPLFGNALGACHGLELPFVFDTLPTCTGPNGLAGPAPPRELAISVHRTWVRFASGGGLPWMKYDHMDRTCFALERGVAARDPEMPADALVPPVPGA